MFLRYLMAALSWWMVDDVDIISYRQTEYHIACFRIYVSQYRIWGDWDIVIGGPLGVVEFGIDPNHHWYIRFRR